MRIVTYYDPPPIPWRSCDWCAVDDETHDFGSPCGYGATEQEAIDNLLWLLEECK